MVAITRKLLWCIAPMLLLATSVVRGESTYESLISRNRVVVGHIDSLSQLITKSRRQLSTAGDERSNVEREIVKMEMELFDLNNLRSSLTEKIISLEKSGKAGNSSSSSSERGAMSSAKQISASPLLMKSLPEEDLENLQFAEADEVECGTLFAEYMVSYGRLRELQQLYDQAKSESEAIEYESEFIPVMSSADSLSALLYDLWSEIYDNKSFAYSMAMELLNDSELIDRQTELAQESALKIAEVEHGEQSLSALKYDYQKRELITIERALAERLKLSQMVDSLQIVSKSLAKSPAVMDLSEVEFNRRNFITYEPIKFVTTTPYNTTTKKIPMVEEYQQGVIYRIQLGAYKYEQLPSIFRGTIPLSKDKALGFWTYYAGGFESMAEAEAAVQLLMRKGFKRPEIVRWLDGVRRNLYREPLPKGAKYRVVISGTEQITEEIESKIESIAPNATLTKTSLKRFVAAPFVGRETAEKLVSDLKELDEELKFSIVEIE